MTLWRVLAIIITLPLWVLFFLVWGWGMLCGLICAVVHYAFTGCTDMENCAPWVKHWKRDLQDYIQ